MKKLAKILILTLTVLAVISLVAVFASADENAVVYETFDAGGASLAVSTSKNLPTSFADNVARVEVYSDVVVASQLTLGKHQSLTINLNGNTIDVQAKILIGGNSSDISAEGTLFTINGGTKPDGTKASMIVDLKGVQAFHTRAGVSVLIDGVDIKLTTGTNLAMDNGSRYFMFKNCTIDNSFNTCIYLSTISSATDFKHSYIFDNTEIILRKGNFLTFNPEITNKNDWDFYLLEGTSVRYPSSNEEDHKPFVQATNTSTKATKDNSVRGTQTLYVGKGVKLAADALLVEPDKQANTQDTDYSNDNNYSTKYAVLKLNEDNTVTVERYLDTYILGYSNDDTYPNQICEHLCSVTIKDGEKILETIDGLADGVVFDYPVELAEPYVEDEKLNVQVFDGWLEEKDGAEVTPHIRVTSDSTFNAKKSWRTPAVVSRTGNDVLGYSLDNELTLDELRIFSAAPVIFYSDVVYVTDKEITGVNGLSIDLNGFTFYKDKLTAVNSGCFVLGAEETVTLTNGTVSSSMTPFAILSDNNSSVTLTDVNVMYDGIVPFDVKSGSVVINGGSVKNAGYSSGRHIFDMSSEGGASSLYVNGSELISSGACVQYTPTVGVADITVNITDTSVECETLFRLWGSIADRVESGTSLDLSLVSSEVNTSGELFDIPNKTDGTSSISSALLNISDCMLSAYPTVECGEVVIPVDEAVSSIDDSVYSYRVMKTNFEMKYNVTIYSDFALNFYIPTDANVKHLTSSGNSYSVEEDLETVNLADGEYYQFVLSGISVNDAADDASIGVTFIATDNKEYTVDYKYSVVSYIEALLDSDESALAKRLAVDAARYIDAAYTYAGSVKPEALKDLMSRDDLSSYAPEVSEAPETQAQKGNLGEAIKSVQLSLGSALKYRLNLKDTFSGTLTVKGNEYTVTNGSIGGKAYIEISMSAYELTLSTLTVTGETSGGLALSGEYSLAAYITAMRAEAEQNEALIDMLDAFYAYCYGACMFMDGGAMPPIDTPDVEVEFE